MLIARIGGPHGVHGEVTAIIQTDFPERFSHLKSVYVGSAGHLSGTYEVESARLHKDRVLIKLAGIDDSESAGQLRNATLSVPVAEAVALPADRFYWRDVVGLQVFSTDGSQIGPIIDILRTGSNDVYLVKGERGVVLIPAIEEVVKEIDIAAKRMVIEPMPGLLE